MFKSFRSYFAIAVLLLFGINTMLLAQKTAPSIGLDPNATSYLNQGVSHPIDLLSTGYGADGIGNQWYNVAIPAGTLGLVGPTGGTLHQGGDFDGNGTFYAVRSPLTLITVNVTTGAETVVGTITGVAGTQTITSVAWNYANSTMYLGTTDITTSQLYTVNRSTAAATLVGTVTNCAGLIAVAINCAGSAYGVDIVGDNLVSIDLSTGAGTVVGPLGFVANYAQDADFDAETGILYLAAYNGTTSAGELRTANLTTGATTLVLSWGGVEITSFAINAPCGPPCPVGAATNPSPASGTTGVNITTPGNITWTNGAGTNNVEVFFGPVGNVVSVYSGAPITTFAIPAPLQYATTYNWRVVDKNDTCSASATTWSFTTEQNPNVLFEDLFANLSQWTVVGPLGLTNWSSAAGTNAGGTTPELKLSWTPSFNGESRLRSVVINAPNSTALTFAFKMYFDWYANPSGTIALDATYDGGVTKIPLWSIVDPTANVGPADFTFDFTSPASGSNNLQLELSFTGNSFNYDYVYFDNMLLTFVVPVELTSFAATTDNKNVNLSWSTATELNNSGFQIERNNGSEYQVVGFVAGHGTTTDVQNYSYTDQNVKAGSYTYRLKQVDFNGTFEYSDAIEVEVLGIKEFALGQNYPNPFNPSTKINFSLAVDSKVSLKIFDVLGQEVATLINGQLAAGSQEVSFNASSLNSGVYFYRIDADGIDGQKFSSVRKMILTK